MNGLEGPGAPGVTRPPVRLGPATFRADVLSMDFKGQDAFLVEDGFAGIADGSTPLDPARGAVVAAFARSALRALRSRRTQQPAQQFVAAITEVSRGLTAVSSPTAAIGLVQVRGADLEAVVLADVTVVIRQRGGVITVLQDDRVGIVDKRSADLIKAILDAGGTQEEARAAFTPVLAAQHATLRNKPGGYWVFGAETAAAGEIASIRVALDTVESILICSDGFYRLCDTFGFAADPAALLAACENHGLAGLGGALRIAELAPGNLAAHPRPARHDDATAVLLRR